MSDESGFDVENEEDEGGSLNINVDSSQPIYVIEGVNQTFAFNNPTNPFGPLFWIKNCVGMRLIAPKGQEPDNIEYIVKIGNTFEYRSLEECIPHDSELEYKPRVKLKSVH